MNREQKHNKYFRTKRKYDECKNSNSFLKKYYFDEKEGRILRIYHFADKIKPFYKKAYNRTIRRKKNNFYEDIDEISFEFSTDDYVCGNTIKKEYNLKNKLY